MSNFNREVFPQHEGILGGPEVVNGTGQVYLEFDDGYEEHTPATFLMDADTVLKLARWLNVHAWTAIQARESANRSDDDMLGSLG